MQCLLYVFYSLLSLQKDRVHVYVKDRASKLFPDTKNSTTPEQ